MTFAGFKPPVPVEDDASDTGLVAADRSRSRSFTRYGVIGHAQASARARHGGKPLILRRDFDTTDGGLAGLHFVSLQGTIADFVATRTAMNAAGAQLQNPSVTAGRPPAKAQSGSWRALSRPRGGRPG